MSASADELRSNRGQPCVGVMCMDMAQSLSFLCGLHTGSDKETSYLAASYPKCVEAAGASVVPIWIGRDRAYYAQIMKLVNGVLLPGGAVYLDDEDKHVKKDSKLTNLCVQSIQYIYELALERNLAGSYFPLWGTCLGFQLLLKSAARAAGAPIMRDKCGDIFDAKPLQLEPGYATSRIFGQLSPEQAKQMESVPFACHQHKFCITEESLASSKMDTDWHVLATRTSEAGMRFITLIEHRVHPFFGCQFHPERAAFEQLFARNDACRDAHTRAGIQLAQYFAEVFVDACRRNPNRFASVEQLSRHLIQNWQPVFSGQYKNSNWREVYLFPKDVDYVQPVDN
ncbi:gamma-glutamyl hydrolase A isoform X2 [Drosophila montana]|uniref:gamma-glutamyl hydrolase A isoform X2 n=1 Tax=Drosophila montana TaxID=40370 RepID=UPI00313D0296